MATFLQHSSTRVDWNTVFLLVSTAMGNYYGSNNSSFIHFQSLGTFPYGHIAVKKSGVISAKLSSLGMSWLVVSFILADVF